MAKYEYPKEPKTYSDFDFSSYQSPISRVVDEVFSDVVKRDNDCLMAQVRIAVGYDINKEELIKALQYDRHQYEVGYADGRFARDREIIRCHDCKYFENTYCAISEWTHGITSSFGYCNRAERRETE